MHTMGRISRWQISLRGNRLPCMRHECTYDTSGGLVTRLTERVDVLKTAKMAKTATLLSFTGLSFGLFALFEVTECGSETDRTRRGCELVATFPGYGHGEAAKPEKMEFRRAWARLTKVLKTGQDRH